jgi:alpha-1,6-mannosyltransferase
MSLSRPDPLIGSVRHLNGGRHAWFTAAIGKSRPDAAYRRLALLGILLLALTLGALALHIPGAITVGSPTRKTLFVALLGVAALVQFGAVSVVLRGVPRGAVWLVIAVALAARIGPLIAPPFLSTDLYRYVWDGRVQAAGINPYRFVPADPALTALRDTGIFPHIARAEWAPTIYPPAAQLVFAAIGVTAPGLTAVKAAMMAFEALAMAAAAVVLSRASLAPSRIIVWAWNPLAIWAFSGNGHVDAVAAGLLAVALMLIGMPGAARTRSVIFAGIAFGAAVLAKFLPLAAAPAFWPRGRWPAAISTALTIVVLYACYAGVGWRVFGFMPGYSAEEGLSDGSGFWLLAGLSNLVSLPAAAAPIYVALAAALLGALGFWIAFVSRPITDREIWRAAGMLMAGATVAVSPHYPWYFAWLALPAIVAPSRTLIWLATAPVLLYADTFGDRFVWPCTVYLPALGLAFADYRQPLDVSLSAHGETA